MLNILGKHVNLVQVRVLPSRPPYLSIVADRNGRYVLRSPACDLNFVRLRYLSRFLHAAELFRFAVGSVREGARCARRPVVLTTTTHTPTLIATLQPPGKL